MAIIAATHGYYCCCSFSAHGHYCCCSRCHCRNPPLIIPLPFWLKLGVPPASWFGSAANLRSQLCCCDGVRSRASRLRLAAAAVVGRRPRAAVERHHGGELPGERQHEHQVRQEGLGHPRGRRRPSLGEQRLESGCHDRGVERPGVLQLAERGGVPRRGGEEGAEQALSERGPREGGLVLVPPAAEPRHAAVVGLADLPGASVRKLCLLFQAKSTTNNHNSNQASIILAINP
eukprot:7002786-Lingulodinium_polyedra.AAC.1